MPPFEQVCAANKQFKPDYRPVVIVLGGTNGIGSGIARKIAEFTSGNVHLIILGRNSAAADVVLASLPKNPNSIYEFEKVDACLMRDVRRVTNKFNAKLDKVNFIIGSSGYIDFKGVEMSDEGLDKKAAVQYYGRWRLILDLLPLVERASEAGEKVGILNVFAAGKIVGTTDFTELGLVFDLKQGMNAVRSKFVAYMDAMNEAVAKRHPNIPLVHTFPGFVASNFGPKWATTLVKWFGFGSKSPEVCGEYSWYPLLNKDAAFGPGVIHIQESADPTPCSPGLTPEVVERVWEHTIKSTEVK